LDVGEAFARGEIPSRAELSRPIEELPIKGTGVHVRGGGRDAFIYTLGGGAGAGDPLLRDPELVARDIRDRYVTMQQAKTAYGVILTPTGIVDPAATDACRSEIRRLRINREPAPIKVGPGRGAPMHLYLEKVGQDVVCNLCGERVGHEADQLEHSTVRRTEVSEALARYGAHAMLHQDRTLVLEERFCPGCATSLDVSVVRVTGSPS
jgi:N-methylhydantoinase B